MNIKDEKSDSPLVFIFGPAAVGKMTVGQELQKLTGYRLLYNHMVVDLVTEFFEFNTSGFHELARPFTTQIIEACARHRLGLIATMGILFDRPGSREVVEHWSEPYRRDGLPIWYAELAAPIDVRITRNATPHRAAHKKIEWATPEHLRAMEEWGRWNSDGDWPDPARRIVIENTDVAPDAAARLIRDRFGL